MKMYKTRITRWGFDKNNKESEMRTIAYKQKQRATVGKTSAFRIRGRPVDMNDVERYIKRKAVKSEGIEVVVSTPPAIECFTPTQVPRRLSIGKVWSTGAYNRKHPKLLPWLV